MSKRLSIEFCLTTNSAQTQPQLINIVIWQVHFMDGSMSEVSANSGDKESGKFRMNDYYIFLRTMINKS